MSQPVALIFGAGANVGLSIVSKFKQEGYKVVAISRTIKDDVKEVADKAVAHDLTPEVVSGIFKHVESDFGPPNVVVFNGQSIGPLLALLFSDSHSVLRELRER